MTAAILRNEPDVGRHFVHHLIATVAKELAGEFYDQMATGKTHRGRVHPRVAEGARKFIEAWPDQSFFIEARWKEFAPTARSALTGLLGRPDLSEAVKADIHEALRLDTLVNPRKLSPEAAAAQAAADQPKR